MKRTLLIPSLLLLATVATTTPAHAEANWVHSQSQFVPYNCSSTGLADSIETWIGYEDDVADPLKTGDSRYVHAIAKAVGQCTDGANMEVFLPTGATRDLSKPVYCIRQKVGTTQQEPVLNCAPSGFTGPGGGLMFTTGSVTLAPTWYLEIQIPVIYNAELLGSAGGIAHSLGVKTMNQQAYALPSIPVTVAYKPKFESFTTSGITGNSATVSLTTFNYLKSGQLSIEYGTSGTFGTSTNPGTLSSMYVYYTNSGAMIPNLLANTTYSWRARYVTSSGTFTSTTQSFTTSPTAAVVLTVAKSGSGLGKITSNPVYFDCGSYSSNVCSANTAPGINVTLYATPSTGAYVFTGWSGECTGTGVCTVSMNASKSVTANFEYFDFLNAIPLPNPRPRRL